MAQSAKLLWQPPLWWLPVNQQVISSSQDSSWFAIVLGATCASVSSPLRPLCAPRNRSTRQRTFSREHSSLEQPRPQAAAQLNSCRSCWAFWGQRRLLDWPKQTVSRACSRIVVGGQICFTVRRLRTRSARARAQGLARSFGTPVRPK